VDKQQTTYGTVIHRLVQVRIETNPYINSLTLQIPLLQAYWQFKKTKQNAIANDFFVN
jgi:hypothetical protein